jgi:hypothetical protein
MMSCIANTAHLNKSHSKAIGAAFVRLSIGETSQEELMSKTKRNSRHKASESAGMTSSAKKVRYAVVGLGYISQVAVLPAFQHARENLELVALVSGNATKRAQLAKHTATNGFPSAWKATKLMLSTSRYPTICIVPTPKAPPEPEFTCFARSPWP